MAKEYAVGLNTLGRGAVIERFDDALREVVENVLDVNCEAESTRSITIKVTLKPNKTRSMCAFNVDVHTKPAPPQSVGGSIYIGRKNGEIVATEYDPEQPSLLDYSEDLDRAARAIADERVEVTVRKGE